MRTKWSRLRSVVLVFCLLGLGSPAMAEEITGKIIAVDPELRIVVLSGGEAYRLPPDVHINDLEPGLVVIFTFEQRDGVRVVSMVELTA